MSWRIRDLMKAREEFVEDMKRGSLSHAETCRRHGISRRTGYKWLARDGSEGGAGLADRSRRPHLSPRRTAAELERRVVEIRLEHPCWGGRKIREILLRAAGPGSAVPAASTVTGILRRHGLLGGGTRAGAGAFVRFERGEPNDLWQMDFKGHFALAGGARCHPLTMLDDHSRYDLVLAACTGETRTIVQPLLEAAFRRYGLPRQILCDHGSPWGVGPGAEERPARTGLSLWLMRLGIDLIHGRPRHPQTQGKEERFHRTLAAEVLAREPVWKDLPHCQREFDRWARIYNEVRPHESLGMKTPGEHYRLSPRSYPERLPEVEGYYLDDDELRKVRSKGEITFGNRTYAVGQALAGEVVALRPGAAGCRDVYYCWRKLGTIDPARATKDKGYQNRLIEG